MGSLGMRRRVAHYAAEYQPYHIASSIGAYLQFIGFAL